MRSSAPEPWSRGTFRPASPWSAIRRARSGHREKIMQAEAQAEHRWLEQLLGDWTYEEEAVMSPGEAPHRSSGRESVRSLGGLWILAEREGKMPDGDEARTLMTVGFDAQKGRFVGTFIGSMMTMLWVYEGGLDEAGKVLT